MSRSSRAKRNERGRERPPIGYRRRWRAHPDLSIVVTDLVEEYDDEGELVGFTETPREIGVLSRDALVESLLDAAALLDRAGGVLSVLVGRERTDMEGESVTTGAVFEWKSGPQAPHNYEVDVDAPGIGTDRGATEDDEPAEPDLVPEAEAPRSDLADALAAEEEEDLSAIPVEQR